MIKTVPRIVNAIDLELGATELQGWSRVLIDLGRLDEVDPLGVKAIGFALERCHDQIAQALGFLEGGEA